MRYAATIRALAFLTALFLVTAYVDGSQAGATQDDIEGWFHVRWGDPPLGSGGQAAQNFSLVDDQGVERLLDIGSLHLSVSELRLLDRRRVRLRGEAIPRPGRPDLIVAQSVELADQQLPAPGLSREGLAVTGSQPWVNILCRFSDSAGVTPQPESYFTGLMGLSEPGMDHYWREVSYNLVNIAGTAVSDWRDLPNPLSFYVDEYGGANLGQIAADCTALHDSVVFYPGFVGINIMLNQTIGCCAWGGSWTLNRDGQIRQYRVTWMPPWAFSNQGVMAHEMGHGFGLPHSSGPYGTPYDSHWDPMSSSGGPCSPFHVLYGCIGRHTISHHKEILGWVSPGERYIAACGTTQTIHLWRLSTSPTAGGYKMALIPRNESGTSFYTVEARRFAGYDAYLPAEAVIIHDVDTTRSDRDAQVVDPDNNGNPNDAAAMWLPGESFVHSGLATVTVLSSTTTGYLVEIARTCPPAAPTWVGATPLSSSQVQLNWTDHSGNEDGFIIYRYGGGFSGQAGSVGPNVTAFTDNGLAPGVHYIYSLLAYTDSAFSLARNTITAIIPGGTPSAPVLESVVGTSTTQVRLTWKDNSANEAGFQVFRFDASNPGAGYTGLGLLPPNTTTFTDGGLQAGHTYVYWVVAQNGLFNGFSPAVFGGTTFAATPDPQAPRLSGGTSNSGSQVSITWSDNTADESGFRVQRWNGTSWQLVATLGPNATGYSESGLPGGTPYEYRVSAFAAGYEKFSPASLIVTTAGSWPAPPALSSAVGLSQSSIRVYWQDNASNETGYKLLRTDSVTGETTEFNLPPGTTTYLDSGLSPSRYYYYWLWAVGLQGTGYASTIIPANTYGP
jgi:hypothetical protein